MKRIQRPRVLNVILLLSMTALTQQPSFSNTLDKREPVLWRDPGNISRRDLKWGPGSPELAPAAPFHFLEEDKQGESPKFRVRDANGVEWSVKVGPEAQSESAATRIVWAVGYFAEEAYYLHRAEIHGLPRLSRGMQHIEGGRYVRGARFEPRREYIKRGDPWRWLKNPFVGTREFNGLKVLMVLLNNYDTSTINNRVLTVTDPRSGTKEERYVVTDLGATLGSVGGMGGRRSKSNLNDFRRSDFIKRVKGEIVEFDYNTTPAGLAYVMYVLAPWYWHSQAEKERAMQKVPLEHARWVGRLLSQLSERQLEDAFEAAGYTRTEASGFVSILRQRSRQLAGLTAANRKTVASRR